jgi:choline-sulfatase
MRATWRSLTSALVLCAPAMAGSSRPPVILISVDTLRADHLSCYGYSSMRTPNIDRLAQGGTLFGQASAQAPLTLPSHASLLTSLYPLSTGIRDNGERLGPGLGTLAEAMRSAGYRTAAFVGGFVLDRRFGLDRGFDTYDSRFNLRRAGGADPGDIKRFGEDVSAAATRWIDQNASAPFFVFLHLYDLHTPYELPPGYRRSPQLKGYDAQLAYVDDVIGRFWTFLERRGLADKALVVFTSDHGEGLGQHGESTHGYFVYQTTLHVPLILRWPAGTTGVKARVGEPTMLLDIAPTILEVAGITRPDQMQGASLVPASRGTALKQEIYAESAYANQHFGCSVLRTLRSGRYKYIDAPKSELYDLSSDPGETRNLYATDPARARNLRASLVALRRRFKAAPAGSGGASSPEAVAALRSLGYLGSGAATGNPESGADPKDRIGDFEEHGRAVALASAGRIAAANAILGPLAEKLPDVPDVRMSLALNQQRLGKHEDAAANLRRVLQRMPGNVVAHFNLAVSLFELGRLDEAAKEANLVLAMAPQYTRAAELLGTVWIRKKDFERAREAFNRLLTVAPEDYTAHYNLGALAIRSGDWDEAERHLLAALAADPNAAEVHNSLGSLYLRRGDLSRAQAAFSQAIRLQPRFAWAHYNLGLVLRKQKRDAEAASAFRAALDADPGFTAAKTELGRIAANADSPAPAR